MLSGHIVNVDITISRFYVSFIVTMLHSVLSAL